MSQSGSLIVSSDLEGFFREQVNDASQSLGINIKEALEYYIVTMLCDFSHRETRRLPGEEPLAILYKRAMEAESIDRIPLLKDLGDVSLYSAGFFLDSIQRSLVDLNYYISMGGTAYSSLGSLIGHQRNGEAFAEIYFELAERFAQMVEILNQISDTSATNLATDMNLVRLYSRWLRTRNPRLHKLLLEKGLVTSFDPPDDVLQ